jgi:prepilin-type N-terminal cleavage/methylation domain-containing protein
MDARKDTALGAPRSDERAGFTFIEVIIAVMLLANATALLIGLEASAIQRAVRDRNTQQAMLVARQILSLIESTERDTVPSEQSNVPVAGLLAQLGVPATTDPREQRTLEQLRASLLVEDWSAPQPNIESPAMKRITLQIAWGPESFENFSILYFMPIPEV